MTRLKFRSLVGQLLLDVFSAENRLQIHPVALHGHPLVKGLVEKPEAFLPCFYLSVRVGRGGLILNRDGKVITKFRNNAAR